MLSNKDAVGIVIAKKNSLRFPGKNFHTVSGVPLFWHSVECLIDAGIKKIYVGTDSEDIKKYCEDRYVNVIDRGQNINKDYQTFFDVLKYCYFAIPEKYPLVVSVLANSIDHKPEDILRGIEIMSKTNIDEIRSYDGIGIENGIIILKEKVILEKHEISNYLGSIVTEGKEIHYRGDI